MDILAMFRNLRGGRKCYISLGLLTVVAIGVLIIITMPWDDNMRKGGQAKSLDLSSPENVDIRYMFHDNKIKTMDFTNFKTSEK